MALRVVHAKLTAIPEDTGDDPEIVGPNDWNADHTIEGAGSAAEADVDDFATAAQGTAADSAVQPGDLAAVATSGDYDDLANKPTLGSLAAVTPTGTPDGTRFLRDDNSWATVAGGGAVDSVNGQSGVVVLDADDISDAGTTNKFATAGEKTKLGHISVTQAVDLDDIETKANGALQRSGGTMTGDIALANDASSAMHPVTKQQLDALAVNLGKRQRVKAATTGNITISTALNNGDTLDGVTLVTGDLVLVKNQSTASQNGIYVVGVSPARASEFDTYDEHPGSVITVSQGTTNDNTVWQCDSNEGGTINSTALSFFQLRVSGELLAANNLSDLANASTARSNLGVAIGSNVQAYNAMLALLAALTDPNNDRLLFWDDSANALAWLTLGTGLTITGTTINAAGGGKADNVVQVTKTNTASIASRTLGDTGLSAAITLASSSNRVLVTVSLSFGGTTGAFVVTDGSNNIISPIGDTASARFSGTGPAAAVDGNTPGNVNYSFVWTPGSVGPHTIKVRFRRSSNTGTTYLNQGSGDTDATDTLRAASTITLQEIGP